MTVKEKQGFGLYFLFAFGMAWLCQVGGCIALLQQNNAVLYQLALIVTMFCPLLAVLLVQKAFLRQPTGIGWKVQGKRRFWLAAWFGPAVLTLLGAVLYFAVFPSRLDFSGSWLVAAYGGEMDERAGERVLAELRHVSRYPAHFIAVCDDIWRGGEEYRDGTEVYVRGLARICRGLAAEFDVVCEMAGGLPRIWKGALPRG